MQVRLDVITFRFIVDGTYCFVEWINYGKQSINHRIYPRVFKVTVRKGEKIIAEIGFTSFQANITNSQRYIQQYLNPNKIITRVK